MDNKNFGIAVGVIIVILLIGGIWWWAATNEDETAVEGTQVGDEAAATGTEAVDSAPAAPSEPALAGSAQAAGRPSVTIARAVLTAAGYIVVHADEEGQPGAMIGKSDLLEPGIYENYTVIVDRETAAGETLYAMLHSDDGSGSYEDTDQPVIDIDGNVVLAALPVMTVDEADVSVDTVPDTAIDGEATTTVIE